MILNESAMSIKYIMPYKNGYWVVPSFGNWIYYYDKLFRNIKEKFEVPKYMSKSNIEPFNGMVISENDIILIPLRAKYLVIYNLINKCLKCIKLGEPISLFQKVGCKIYMLNGMNGKLFQFDINSMQLQCLSDIFEFLKRKFPRLYLTKECPLFVNMHVNNRQIVCPCRKGKCIYYYDLKTNKEYTHEIYADNTPLVDVLLLYNKEYILNEKGEVYCLSSDFKKKSDVLFFCDNEKCRYPYRHILYSQKNDVMCLIPQYENRICFITNGEISYILLDMITNECNIQRSCSEIVCLENDSVLALLPYHGSAMIIDIANKKIKETVKINFKKDIVNELLFLSESNIRMKYKNKNYGVLIWEGVKMKDVAIFGTGKIGMKAYYYYGERVKLFIDNDRTKQGTNIEGIPIVSFQEYTKNHINLSIVVAIHDNETVIRQIEEYIPQGHGLKMFLNINGKNIIHNLFSVTNNKNEWDICLNGLMSEYSYGAEISLYSMYTFLTSLGYKVLINQPPRTSTSPVCRVPILFKQMPYDINDVGCIYETLEDMKELNNKVRCFLLNSGQLWNPVLMKKHQSFSLLPFAEKSVISYATSFGKKNWCATAEETVQFKALFKKIQALSVRETSAQDICKFVFQENAVKCIDSVFLNDRKFYDKLAEQSNSGIPDKTVSTYIMYNDNKRKGAIKEYTQQNGYFYNDFDNAIYVSDWLKQIRDSYFLITDSFHAACFAIMFEVNFVVIGNAYCERLKDLLSMTSLNDRFIKKDETINIDRFIKNTTKFSEHGRLLDNLIKSSKEWLIGNLEMICPHNIKDEK